MITILSLTQALPSMDDKLVRIEDGIKLMGEGSSPKHPCWTDADIFA
jgi:hypothetical protein